ncbi:glycosyltransferase family 2 protein [Halorubrum sp. DTA98]|uniref:glycosyltransferase family 2 protein n=1 Tax=Halorubrum sp. DTA98 TaxID=3402163 RepID=UPI003AAA80EC
MYEETTVGVVVPAYNEEGFVGEVIETLPAYVDRAYVVDDCSTDGTWDEIRTTADRVNGRSREETERREHDTYASDGGETEAFDRQVVPIRHEENRGVGGAIKTGYLRARREGIGVTAVMGGDGQMDPDELTTVIDPIVDGEADYVKGNRLLSADDRKEMPGHRYVGNVILTYLTRIASGYWRIGDPQNGYTAISAAALAGAKIEEMFEFYGYCNDLLVRLSTYGFRVVDVPISARYRDEESHIDYRTYVPIVSLMLLRAFLWRLVVRRETRAEAARSGLYVGGAIGVLVGVASSLRSLRTAVGGSGDESVSVDDGGTAGRTGGDALDDGGTAGRTGDDALTDGGRPERTVTGGVVGVVGVLLLICGMVVDATINRALNETLQ